MKYLRFAFLIILALMLAGCAALTGEMPSSQSTSTPVPTAQTSTPMPTLENLTSLDAAYCMESDPEAHEKEYSILRFFPSGVVLQVTIKGKGNAQETWEYIKPYLKESATDVYSHGEYQHSEGQVQFYLAPAGSDEASGTVSGTIENGEMILDQQGTQMIYLLVYGGES